MTITSTNHNPANASKYARHRSIFKGRTNKLHATVQALQAAGGMSCHEYLGVGADMDFNADWSTKIGAKRELGLVVRHWKAKRPAPSTIQQELPAGLRGDFRMIWEDFSVIGKLRFADSDKGDYSGDQLIFLAYSRVSLDLIFSKWGYGDNCRRNHHFFHWQARLVGVENAVNVDDYLAAA
jgi:hypothetical protein